MLLFCTTCCEYEEEDQFPIDRSCKNRGERGRTCRSCLKSYRETRAPRETRHDKNMREHREFFPDVEVCQICGHKNGLGRELCVDHDHKTGHVRGLICSTCNLALGYLGDSVAGLRRALEYLDRDFSPNPIYAGARVDHRRKPRTSRREG